MPTNATRLSATTKAHSNVGFYVADKGNDSLTNDRDMVGTAANDGTGTDAGTQQEEADSFQNQEANLRRDADRLQALIEGNTLGPRSSTPPRQTARTNSVRFNEDDGNNNSGGDGNGKNRGKDNNSENADGGRNKDKDKRSRKPTVDLEEETYRQGRKERRDKERLLRRSRSESQRDLGPAPLSPWSALGRSGRPEGYSRDQVNALGVAGAIALKGWEREEDRHREALIAKPGMTIAGTLMQILNCAHLQAGKCWRCPSRAPYRQWRPTWTTESSL